MSAGQELQTSGGPAFLLASPEQQLAFHAQMLDAVDASVVATDLDGMVVVWSEGAQRLHGWSAGEAIGRPIHELTVPVEHHGAAGPSVDAVVAAAGWEGDRGAAAGRLHLSRSRAPSRRPCRGRHPRRDRRCCRRPDRAPRA